VRVDAAARCGVLVSQRQRHPKCRPRAGASNVESRDTIVRHTRAFDRITLRIQRRQRPDDALKNLRAVTAPNHSSVALFAKMYWPVGTPRIYASPGRVDNDDASSSAPPARPPLSITVSHDGIPTPAAEEHPTTSLEEVAQSQLIPADAGGESTSGSGLGNGNGSGSGSGSSLHLGNNTGSNGGGGGGGLAAPLTPNTPHTPLTPAIKSVEQDENGDDGEGQSSAAGEGIGLGLGLGLGISELPRKEPILALRIARSGLLFATITATNITVWQTKVHFPESRSHDGSED
jgi:hypothetical protein